jgi:type I restriction enzyme M protein
MEERINSDSRTLLKERFPYPIFLYEAEHVGITATGETDNVPNELVPNEFKPPDVEQTTLELYKRFKVDPKPFLSAGAQE